MFFFFAVSLLFKIEKSFICSFLFKIFDFLLYTSLADLYILKPPKCWACVDLRGSVGIVAGKYNPSPALVCRRRMYLSYCCTLLFRVAGAF